jgi:hypothetical protein
LVDAQRKDGFQWDLHTKGKTHRVVFKPEVCMVLGDNEGQTKFCGMYQTRGNEGVKCLCRHCKVETTEIHRTYDEVYDLHNRREINKWIEEALGEDKVAASAAEEKLRACSHHPVRNAFRLVSFGWYGLGNINAATPADIMHTINLGMMMKVEEAILGSRKPNANAIIAQIQKDRKEQEKKLNETKKKRVDNMISVRYEKYIARIENAHTEEEAAELQAEMEELNLDMENTNQVVLVTEAFTKEEMSKFLVFSDSVLKLVETMAKMWGWKLLHQSDRSIGRTHFVSGITSGSKVQAHEMVGKMVLYLLMFCSDFSAQYFETKIDDGTSKKAVHKGGQRELLNSNRVADYVWAIEEVLLLTEYMKSDLTLHEVNELQRYTPKSMYRLKKSLNRLTGMGMNFIKFHLMSHRPLNIRQLGNPIGYDTQVVEKNHIYVSKRTSKRTSRHSATLDVQSSMRNWENLVIDRGMLNEACQCTFIKKPKEPTREDDLELLDDTSTTEFVDTTAEPDEGELETDRLPSQIITPVQVRRDNRTGTWDYKCELTFSGNHKKRKKSDKVKWHDEKLQSDILYFLSSKVLPLTNIKNPILVYHRLYRTCAGTEYVFKSDPLDANHKFRGHGWHDWALVRLKGSAYGNLHAETAMHIMSIIEITDNEITCVDKDNIQIKDKGYYLVGHLLKQGLDSKKFNKPDKLPVNSDDVVNNENQGTKPKKRQNAASNWSRKKKKAPEDPRKNIPSYEPRLNRAHVQSRLVMSGQKYGTLDNARHLVPTLCVVPASCIMGVTIAVPNIIHLSETKKKEDLKLGESIDGSYLFVNGKQHWPRIMRQWIHDPV